MADQTRLIHELHRPIRSAGINAHALSAAHTSANTYYLDELGPVAARTARTSTQHMRAMATAGPSAPWRTAVDWS